MKRISTLLLIFLLGKTVYSQKVVTGFEKPEVHIGLDVLKNLPPLLLGKDYFIHNTIIFEPSVKVQKRNGSNLFHIGIMKTSTNNPYQEMIYRDIKGVYVKIGTERQYQRYKSMVIGWNGMLSFSDFRGTFHMRGTTFGDYEGALHEKSTAVGTEVYWAHNSQIKTRWIVRSLVRVTAAVQTGDLNAEYYPGIGYTDVNSQILLSLGTTVQIYRRVR